MNRWKCRAYTPRLSPALNPPLMPQDHTTVVVSVNTEWDEETRLQHINAQVENGWRVQSVIPISGGEIGPGGESEDFLRLQVTLVRDIDAQNVIVTDRGAGAPGAQPEEASRTAAARPDEPGMPQRRSGGQVEGREG